MESLIILIVLFLIGWFLWSAVRSKEIACKIGMRHCERLNIQFLDHTVERVQLRLTRDHRKNPCWYRTYQFEFATSGEHRYQGLIEMYGHHFKSITLDPYPDSTLGEEHERYITG